MTKNSSVWLVFVSIGASALSTGCTEQSFDDGDICRVTTELCDGEDNDCDGVVDNGNVCPDPTVRATHVFTRGVYHAGTTTPHVCGGDALQQIWPTLTSTYFGGDGDAGFDCYAYQFMFRRTDDQIFYTASFSGIHQDDPAGADPVVPTPPCGDEVVHHRFDFDATATLHYQCADTVRRGNGAIVAEPVRQLLAVLDDGRILATRASNTAEHAEDVVVLDPQGNEISRLALDAEYTGEMALDPGATTVDGNRAYVLFERIFGQGERELVVYHLDAESAWQRVRRVAVADFGIWRLVVSDGTVFASGLDQGEHVITAYLPDNTSRVVWRESNATTVHPNGDKLLVGPRRSGG